MVTKRGAVCGALSGGNFRAPRQKLYIYLKYVIDTCRECVSMGAAGAQIRRSVGHHLLHPQILRLLVLLKLADFEAQSSLL